MAVVKRALDVNEVFSCTTSRDLRDMVLGDFIAEGTTRVVFHHAMDKSLVVKMEKGYDSFRNVAEYESWKLVYGTAIEDWFAPITFISSNGRFILQKKTKPIKQEQLPKKVPACMHDLKLENWGLYKGKPVCHDYAMLIGVITNRFKKANWC